MERISPVKAITLFVTAVGIHLLIFFFTLKFDLFLPDYSPAVLRLLLTILLAWLIVTLWGGRFSSLGWRHFGTFFTGAGVAALFIVLVIAAAWLGGAIEYNSPVTGGQGWLYLVFIFLFVALYEEILYTGVLFGVLNRGIGVAAAVIISQAVFAAMHLLNPYAAPDIFGLFVLFLGGCFTVALYIGSGSLWMPIGAHFTWNFVQIIFLRHFSYTGTPWAAEGFFGLEAWPLTLCLIIPLVAASAWWAHRKTAAKGGTIAL